MTDSIDARAFGEAVALIYEAALNPLATPEALRGIMTFVGGTGSSMMRFAGGELREFHAFNHNEAGQAAYNAHFHRIDPGLPWIATAVTEQWGMDGDMFDLRRPAHHEYVFDFCRPNDIYHAAALKLFQDSDGFGLFSIQRGKGLQPFREDGQQKLELLGQHLARASLVRRRLDAAFNQQRILVELLDRVADAVFVVTATARVVFANTAALEMARAGGPAILTAEHLAAPDSDLNARLGHSIRSACSARGKAAAFRVNALANRSHLIHVVPVAQGSALEALDRRALAIVLISDPLASAVDTQTARMLLGITVAEARLVVELVKGATLTDTSLRTGVSLATLRTQLASVFAKSGVKTQAQLVALVKSLPRVRT